MALAMAILVSLFSVYTPVAVAADTVFGPYTVGNITWEVRIPVGDTAGTLYISPRVGGPATVAMPAYTNGTAPWAGHSAQVRLVEIDRGITTIGAWAFADFSRLENVLVRGPASGSAGVVTSIGNDAFRGCVNLQYFWNDTALTVFEGVTGVGDRAFYNCSSLEYLDIDSATSIGADVFIGCRSLRWVRVTGAGRYVSMRYDETGPAPTAVYGATESSLLVEMNTAVPPQPIRIIKSSVDLAGNTLDNTGTPTSFVYAIPPTVATVDAEAFAYLLNITEFVIPASVTTIRDLAFAYIRNPAILVYGGLTQATFLGNAPSSFAANAFQGIVDTFFEIVFYPQAAQTWQTPRWNGYRTRVDSAGVSLDQYVIVMMAGTTAGLRATVHPAQARQAVEWTSANTGVAVVAGRSSSFDPTAVITALTPGTATVRAVALNNNGLPGVPEAYVDCTVIVLDSSVAPPPTTFIPVTDVTLNITSMMMGTDVNLNDYAAALPAGATANTLPTGANIVWTIVADGTNVSAQITNGVLSVPWSQTGTVTVEASVIKGVADIDWGYYDNLNFIKRFSITVTSFIPVTNITDVPTTAYAGQPLYIGGTINPAGASQRQIAWSVVSENAGAVFDAASCMLIAQRPGTVTMRATVENGRIDNFGYPENYTQTFIIRVDPYITNTLTIHANPGGSISPSGTRQLAGGEEIQLTAVASIGYIFAGWQTSDGGWFADAGLAATRFTMPGNPTTVTAFFTYTGYPGSSGGSNPGNVVLPTPVHYFTSSSVYIRNSAVSFGHVTVRSYQLFRYVALDGRTLTRNSHYTAYDRGGSTEIILANGFLNGLSQSTHTLTVYFSDNVSVTTVFTVLWDSYVTVWYNDVFSSDWFYTSVGYVTDRRWMAAASSEPGWFRPNNQVTQGEVIDSMYLMVGSPTILNMYNQPLQGRDASYEWVRANGILPIGGVFNLNSPITRQDMTVLFGRLASALRLTYPVVRTATVFSDDWQIDISARAPINSLYRAGIINGRTTSTFVPLGNVTRAEFATFLRQFAETMGNW